MLHLVHSNSADEDKEYVNDSISEFYEPSNLSAVDSNQVECLLRAKNSELASQVESGKNLNLCLQEKINSLEREIASLNFSIGQKDALIEQKDAIIGSLAESIDAHKNDYEDVIALNLAEYTMELNEIKEKLAYYENVTLELDLKQRIKTHNDEMLPHVQRLRAALLGDDELGDERTELLFEDLILSMMHNAIEVRDPAQHVSVSDVACRMGYKFNRRMLAKVGVPIAARYRRMTGEIPNKHTQFVDGKINTVNSYTEEHRQMIAEELRKAWGRT